LVGFLAARLAHQLVNGCHALLLHSSIANSRFAAPAWSWPVEFGPIKQMPPKQVAWGGEILMIRPVRVNAHLRFLAQRHTPPRRSMAKNGESLPGIQANSREFNAASGRPGGAGSATGPH